jgi:hypothetical protein
MSPGVPVLLLILLWLAPIDAGADRVHLKSGQDFEVEQWWEQGDRFFYQRLGGIVAIPRGDVERVERTEMPAAQKAGAPQDVMPRPCDPFDPLITAKGAVPCVSPRPDPCEPRFPKVGYPEAAIYGWAACRGYTTTAGRVLSSDLFRVSVTLVSGAIEKQFVVGPERSRTHISTRNGTITAIQRRE